MADKKETGRLLSRTAAIKQAKREEAAAANPAPTETLTPENYDVKQSAQDAANKYGHVLGAWSNAAAGVPSFWHSACTRCGVAFFARWMPPPQDGEHPFPTFGASENAGRKACIGNPGGQAGNVPGGFSTNATD